MEKNNPEINPAPLFSTIIPVYNAAEFLPQCVESLLSQAFPGFELILVDDGSTDDSGKISDEYAAADNRVRIVHKTNGGVSSARNTGVELARGQWITFVDADDWVAPSYYETLHRKLEEEAACDLLFFGSYNHYEDRIVHRIPPAANASTALACQTAILDLLVNDEHYNHFGFTWNKVFRKRIITDNGIRFIPNLRLSEDEAFTLDFCRYASSLVVLPDLLYNYRIGTTNSLTKQVKSGIEYRMLAACFLRNTAWMTYPPLKEHYRHRYQSLLLYAILYGGENLLKPALYRELKTHPRSFYKNCRFMRILREVRPYALFSFVLSVVRSIH